MSCFQILGGLLEGLKNTIEARIDVKGCEYVPLGSGKDLYSVMTFFSNHTGKAKGYFLASWNQNSFLLRIFWEKLPSKVKG